MKMEDGSLNKVCVVAVVALIAVRAVGDQASYVNPFVGTDGPGPRWGLTPWKENVDK